MFCVALIQSLGNFELVVGLFQGVHPHTHMNNIAVAGWVRGRELGGQITQGRILNKLCLMAVILDAINLKNNPAWELLFNAYFKIASNCWQLEAG